MAERKEVKASSLCPLLSYLFNTNLRLPSWVLTPPLAFTRSTAQTKFRNTASPVLAKGPLIPSMRANWIGGNCGMADCAFTETQKHNRQVKAKRKQCRNKKITREFQKIRVQQTQYCQEAIEVSHQSHNSFQLVACQLERAWQRPWQSWRHCLCTNEVRDNEPEHLLCCKTH